MNSFNGLGTHLGNLARLSNAQSRSISAENPSDAKGGGARAVEWEMPFRSSTRVTVENLTPEDVDPFFFQIDYALTEVEDDRAYLHAQQPDSPSTRFEQELRVTVQALGWRTDFGGTPRYLRLQDDIASTSWWYQAEPHAAFPPLPPADELEVI
ncbi:MAG: DUF2961 domain-containing protein [Jatrophihabitans sp.]